MKIEFSKEESAEILKVIANLLRKTLKLSIKTLDTSAKLSFFVYAAFLALLSASTKNYSISPKVYYIPAGLGFLLLYPLFLKHLE